MFLVTLDSTLIHDLSAKFSIFVTDCVVHGDSLHVYSSKIGESYSFSFSDLEIKRDDPDMLQRVRHAIASKSETHPDLENIGQFANEVIHCVLSFLPFDRPKDVPTAVQSQIGYDFPFKIERNKKCGINFIFKDRMFNDVQVVDFETLCEEFSKWLTNL